MHKCQFCGRFLLTSYNQHLAITHEKEWNKIKKEWVKLYNDGLSIKNIATDYHTNVNTVNKAIKDFGKLY
ncbi:MAG: helix-turn-helix domain-containing protein [DPANN group archaeon]|nr:helix-turn-helix domain-containing protein [DPANN group archaeon]